MKRRTSIACVVLVTVLAIATWVSRPQAEEGGSGHYGPGGVASFIDGLPGRPGALGIALYYTNYQGKAEGNREIPEAGLVTFGLDAVSNVATLVALYQTKVEFLSGSLAFGAAVPFIWLDARASVEAGLGTIKTSDSARGLGDITVYPFMLGWASDNKDLKYDARFGVYAPTGSYETGELANLGKNYWTFEPGFYLSYFGTRNGREATAFVAFDFNTKNTDTDYQSGTQFHLDVTLAQHLPFLEGALGLGGNGFVYQQLAGDSWDRVTLYDGTTLGDFKGRTVGVGPVLSYMKPGKTCSLAAEVKWLPELDVDKRLEGDFIWAKLAYMF